MLTLLVAAMVAAATPDERHSAFSRASTEFAEGLEKNDAASLEQVLSPDWVIIESDGRPIPRDRFLAVLASGELKHTAMHSSEVRTRIIGDAAVQTMRAQGSGVYAGQAYSFDERATDFWIWQDGRWLCVLTQLTRISN
jgi:hypothetical protein